MQIVKTHAFGNDFLLVDEAAVPPGIDRARLARATCERHRGLGGDGLIVYRRTIPSSAAPSSATRSSATPSSAAPSSATRSSATRSSATRSSATMALSNADGSYSEVSGNGVRCLAAWLVHQDDTPVGASITIDTDAGAKVLAVLERSGVRSIFRAAMGKPEDLARVSLDVDGHLVDAVTMRVGNPQCVVLGDVTQERLHHLAAKLAVHTHFPAGTNVELATVEEPDRVRILIWERGVGPTEASGTGACAAAVAAMEYGGANRDVMVVSPGGQQRVEWLDGGLYLTGSAEIIAVCAWQAPP